MFHYPLPIEDATVAGRSVHVRGMLAGMRSIADVEVVDGYSGDRLAAMKRVSAKIRDGARYDAVFSEASTTPTSLNDPHHLPIHPIADAMFFRSARRNGIPVGLFYPDVHWKFDHYRSVVPVVQRLAATAMYRFDLLWYRRAIDVLFLPSLEMAASVPGWENDERVAELFPAADDDPLPWTPVTDQLRLLYVGGVSPPLYDIEALLEAVVASPKVHLVVCCPVEQRIHLARFEGHSNIDIIHESGGQLRGRYEQCDIACLVYPDYDYRRFAMPVKLFEAIGAARPLLASPRNAAARFISTHDAGWIVEPDAEQIRETLEHLRTSPGEIASKRASTLQLAPSSTWSNRAAGVLERLGIPLVPTPDAG